MPVVLARMAKNGVNWRYLSRMRFEKSRTKFCLSETSGIYHLLTETEGNSVFCGPETVDVSRGEAEGNIDGRGSTKHTAFPRSQSISVLLYINSQRNNKLKNK